MVAYGLEIGDDGLERAVLAEEDAELERVLVHGRLHLLEAVAEPLLAGGGDAVERLVRPLGLAHVARDVAKPLATSLRRTA